MTRDAVSSGTSDRGRPSAVELWVVAAIVVGAAILRLVGLDGRGTWDSDQGNDMLTWLALVRDGTIPLLGPPTSIGDFHHGALYYYVLAPAAWLNGAQSPIAVLVALALAGAGAVAVTWWLGRAIGGSVAGIVAALLLAVSAAAIEGSTFIWNPNIIALSSAAALACAWHARRGGGPRWWIGAALATAVTMHAHVLGTALFPIVAGLWIVELREGSAQPRQGAVWRAGLIGLLLIGLSYVPLVVHELGSGFSETTAALDFIGSGGSSSQLQPVLRPVIVGLRVIAWPLMGMFVDALALAVAAVALAVGSAIWRSLAAAQPERSGARWLGAGLAWSIAVLSVGAASLTTVVRALPVDHYHAFVDPIVIVLTALGLAAVYRASIIGRLVAVVVVGGLVAWNLAIAPPAVHPDGGYPAAVRAAERVVAATDGRPVALLSLPDIKPAHAMRYPLTILGANLVPDGVQPPPESWLVVLCDDRFHEAIGDHCGGPAEDAAVRGGVLVDRFTAHPDRWVSLYAPTTVATVPSP